MASCWVLTGLIFLAIAFIASAVGFVVPYWVHLTRFNIPPVIESGLWAECHRDQCTWFFENDFRWLKDQTTWMKACQGLYGFGIVTIFSAFLIACINLCCGCCKHAYSIINMISGLLIFAFLEIGTALALYGVKMNKENGADLEGSSRFLWGYWVGVGGCLLTLIAGLLYTCAGCSARSYDGYERGDVV